RVSGEVRRRYVRWWQSCSSPSLRATAEAWSECGQRSEGLPVSDNCPALSKPRFCADQTHYQNTHRYGVCAWRYETEGALDRYGRICQEGSYHASDPNHLGG